jgi:hypothetical protein
MRIADVIIVPIIDPRVTIGGLITYDATSRPYP